MSRINSIEPGESLPERSIRHDIVQSFLYNAAIWNAHRIHFDTPYAMQVEGYPGLVVAGPLMGDWLTQCAMEWLGEDGDLVTFEYSNRRAAYVGDLLRISGRVLSKDVEHAEVKLELQVSNEAGEILTPATAVVRFRKAEET